MSNWDEDEDGYCTAAEDFQDARSVCEQLGIPLHKVEFRGRVPRSRLRVLPRRVSRRAHAESGRALQSRDQVRRLLRLRAAARRRVGRHRSLRARRARRDGASARLLRGVDAGKDQSYFLHAMPAQALARTLFPIGALHKERRAPHGARARRCPCSTRRTAPASASSASGRSRSSSRSICRRSRAISRRPRAASVGEHRGPHVLHARSAPGSAHRRAHRRGRQTPWYVADKDLRRNVLIVVQGHDHPRCSAAS